MRDGDGGGSAPAANNGDWSSGPQTVQAQFSGLAGYYENMTLEVALPFGSAQASSLAPIPESIREGLVVAGSQVSPLAEAIDAANAFLYNQAQFAAFMKDVQNGLTYMASAVGVVAEMYGNSDNANKASLQDINYAFGDPNARPTGTPPKGAISYTMAAIQQAANGSGPGSLAALDSTTGIVGTSYVDSAGRTTVRYSDGSYRVSTIAYDDNPVGTQETVVTTVYNKDNSVFTVTTNSTFTYKPTGAKTTTVTTGPSEDPHAVGTVSTSTTTDGVTGDRTITTNSVSQDQHGNPKTDTSTVTVKGGDTSASDPGASDDGLIQQTETKYDTAGSNDTVAEHGHGY